MLYSIKSVVVVSSFIVICSALAVGQGRNSITGFVFGEDRTPVARVYVELQTDLYSTVGRVQTNGAGMFTFRGLPSGTYSVKVLAIGTHYEEQSQTVSLIPISRVAGGGAVSEQVDFYLRPRRTQNPLAAPEVVFAQEVPEAAKKLYEDGLKELENKNEQAGYDKLKQSLEVFPDYFVALDRLGNEYLRQGHSEASFVLFTRAVAVNPRSLSSTLGLGISEFKLGRAARSAEHFEAVIKLHKENVNAHYWLGVALHSAGKTAQALTALQKAERLSEGKSAEVKWQLARVYKDQNKFKESADALEQYLKLNPEASNAEEIRQIIKTLRAKQAT